MWMSETNNFYAIDTRGTFISGTSGRFTQDQISKKSLTKIWGLSDTSVYVIGRDGLVLHFDGTNWTDMSSAEAGFCIELPPIRVALFTSRPPTAGSSDTPEAGLGKF